MEIKMSEIISFIQNHYDELLAILGSVVTIATIIVGLTPNTKDNEILNKINNIIEKFRLLNNKENKSILKKNKK